MITGFMGARQVCRWIFQAAKGCCDHNLSHLLFTQVTRKASVADEPALLQIIPDCFKRLPTTCLQAPDFQRFAWNDEKRRHAGDG